MFQWYGVTFVEDDWSTWWDFPENLCPETAQRYPPSLWQVTMINTAFTCGCIQYYRYCFHHFLCLRNFKILHLFFNYRGATERIFSINSNSGEAWRKLGVEKVECCLHVLCRYVYVWLCSCCIYLSLTIEFPVCPQKEVLISRNQAKMTRRN